MQHAFFRVVRAARSARVTRLVTSFVGSVIACSAGALLPQAVGAQPWSVPSSLYTSYYQDLLNQGLTGPLERAAPGSKPSLLQWREEGASAFTSRSVLGWRPSQYYGAEIAIQPVSDPVFMPFGATGPRHRFTEALIPLTVNAYAPFLAQTELTGRVGYLLNNSQRSDGFCFDMSGRAYNCRNTPLTLGVGVRYELHDRFGVRMNYDLLDVKDVGVGPRSRSSVFSLGADYRY